MYVYIYFKNITKYQTSSTQQHTKMHFLKQKKNNEIETFTTITYIFSHH